MNYLQCYNFANTSNYFNNESVYNHFNFGKIEPILLDSNSPFPALANFQPLSLNNTCGLYDNIVVEWRRPEGLKEINILSESDGIGITVAKSFVDLVRYFGLKRHCSWSSKKLCVLFLATKPETVQFMTSSALHSQIIQDSLAAVWNGILDDMYKLSTPVKMGNYHLPKVLDSAFQTYLDIRARLD